MAIFPALQKLTHMWSSKKQANPQNCNLFHSQKNMCFLGEITFGAVLSIFLGCGGALIIPSSQIIRDCKFHQHSNFYLEYLLVLS